ncbi:MAG: hypothetical protein AVDCRST_MAG64-735, partial [uncultured Phycisphaerae bacterium]
GGFGSDGQRGVVSTRGRGRRRGAGGGDRGRTLLARLPRGAAAGAGPDRRVGGRAGAVRGPDEPRHPRGGPRAGPGAVGGRVAAGRGGARQPRLRGGAGRRGTPDRRRRRHPPPRRRFRRGQGRRPRRGQGVRRRVRPRHALRLRRAGHQALRPGGHRRGPQARVGPRAHEGREEDRRAALRADPRDGRRRAAGDLRVPRLRPVGGAAEPIPGDRLRPRSRPQGRSGRADPHGDPGLQRGGARHAQRLPEPPPVPRDGRARRGARDPNSPDDRSARRDRRGL